MVTFSISSISISSNAVTLVFQAQTKQAAFRCAWVYSGCTTEAYSNMGLTKLCCISWGLNCGSTIYAAKFTNQVGFVSNLCDMIFQWEILSNGSYKSKIFCLRGCNFINIIHSIFRNEFVWNGEVFTLEILT